MFTDFHSHILPGIDDGSRSMEESLGMLRMEAEQGIRHVVATPHFYPQHDDISLFVQKRKCAEELLRENLNSEMDFPEVSIGAEVYFFSGISDSEALSQLTIEGTKYLLLEMPQSPWKDYIYREVADIYNKQGIVPIIAHVDRYIAPFRTFGIPERLAELPVLVQANASFFLNRRTSGMAMRMLKKGQIHLLGSDCHNLKYRPPKLGYAVQAIRNRLGDEILTTIEACAENILRESRHAV